MDSTKIAGNEGGRRADEAPVAVLDKQGTSVLRYRDPAVTEGSLFFAIGSALAVVGVIDLSLVWFPMQLGTAGWEFAAVSRTFTNAPMTMVGLVLMAFGLVRRGTRPTMVRRMSVLFAALSLVLVAMGMLFALAAPAVLAQAAGGAAASALKRAIFKNGVEIVVYPVMLLTVAAILWRAVWEDKVD